MAQIIKTACGHFAAYPIIYFLAVSAAYGQETNRAQDARLAYALWKCAAYSIFSGNSEYESNHFFERGYGYYVKATTSVSDEPAELELRKSLPSFFIHGHRYTENSDFSAGVAWAQLLNREFKSLLLFSDKADLFEAEQLRTMRAKQKFEDANCLLLSGTTK